MKIGFVLDDSLDKTDGVQQYVLTLGHWLSDQGHEVHYLVGQTNRRDIPHVHSLSRNVQVHFNQNRMSTPLPASKRAIRRLLDEQRFDVLHVQLPCSPFLAGRIIKAASAETAVVGTFHIIPFSSVESNATRLLRLSLRRVLGRFDKVVSVSQPAARFARAALGLKSDVLPNAVDLAQFQRGRRLAEFDDGKLNIVFLGRLVERKGGLHLLKAIGRLHADRELDGARVLICGKGPQMNRLEDFVKRNRLGGVVKFAGYLSEADKADYLASAHIAVLPSLGGESFGIVLVEAMAAGAEVVLAGDNQGYRSIMAERPDQLIDPTDTGLFAERLRRFIFDQRARRAASQWQRDHVRQYDVQTVGTALLKLYDEAIAKRQKNVDNKVK